MLKHNLKIKEKFVFCKIAKYSDYNIPDHYDTIVKLSKNRFVYNGFSQKIKGLTI